jgi:NHL repeat
MAEVSGHIYDFSFGEYGTQAGQFRVEYSGFGMDIDESTGDIYVADTSNARIQKFDEDGNFILTWGYGVKDGANEFQVCEAPETCHEGAYGIAPGQMEVPLSVAVDNSGGPNDGDVYVADSDTPCCAPGPGRELILKYSEDGNYLGMINGEGSPSGAFHELGWRRTVAVDNLGYLWALEATGNNGNTARVLKFSNQANNAYVGGSEWNPVISPYGYPEIAWTFELTVAPDGSYVYLPEYETLYRFVSNGSASREVMRLYDGPGYYADMDIDPQSGHLIVSSENRIQEYIDTSSSTEALGPIFGAEQLSDVAGLTVNGETGRVYAGDENQAKVFVYKPRRVPSAVTDPATEVRHTTATLEGHTAKDPIDGGDVTECYFEWGETKAYGHVIPCDVAPPITEADVEADVSGLLQEGTYHYRLIAANEIDANRGQDQTFKTHAVLGLNTGQATNLTASTATLNTSFETDEVGTEYFFEWGRKEDELNQETSSKNGGSASGITSGSADLQGLEDYTTYYYRAVAKNSYGVSYGAKKSFRTTPPALPDIAEDAANKITDTGAQLSAVVTPHFGEVVYGFEWGESVAYDSRVWGKDLLPADDQGHSVQANVGGLKPGSTYHFRAVAVNFGGISYGEDHVFSTLDVPKVLSSSTSALTSVGVSLEALIQPSGSPTSVKFEYGPDTSYGATTGQVEVGDGNSAVPVSVNLSGLSAGTLYHFRASATNSIGTALGVDQTFFTAAPPPPPPPPVKRCGRGFVKRHGKCVPRRTKHRRNRKHPATNVPAAKNRRGE